MKKHVFVAIATAIFTIGSTVAGLKVAWAAAPQEPLTKQPAVVKQVANDLYFFYEYDGSNSAFLVTDAGVLVIDTREHPRAAQDFVAHQETARIMKSVENSSGVLQVCRRRSEGSGTSYNAFSENFLGDGRIFWGDGTAALRPHQRRRV